MATSKSALADTIMDSASTTDTTATYSTLAALKGALVETLKAKTDALLELEAIRSGGQGICRAADIAAETPTPSVSTKCYFLDHLPLEIRNMIYKNLLVSKILSDLRSIPSVDSNVSTNTPAVSYDLSPNIFRTCRQVYDEASAVLYRNNTFIFDFQRSYRWFSPLNRKFNLVHPVYNPHATLAEYNAEAKALAPHPLLRKVRHWKVIVGTDGPYEEVVPPSHHIFELCKVLDEVQPSSLKVVVAPWNSHRDGATFAPSFHYPTLRAVLRPFRYLRNVEGFELVQGTDNDFIHAAPSPSLLGAFGAAPDQPVYKQHRTFDKLKIELEALVRSNEPVSHIIKMYRSLVRYAQAFERNEKFKSEMSPEYEEVLQRIRNSREDLFLGNMIPDLTPSDLEILKSGSFRSRDGGSDLLFSGSSRSHNRYKSPFKAYACHPVERALEEASYAWENNKIILLKQTRRVAIEYLEPQYQRIVAASLVFNEFVKDAKSPGGILDPESLRYLAADITKKCNRERAHLALRAEKYAECFQRDIPEYMELVFRLTRNEFRYAYSQLPRELLLLKLNEMFETRAPYPEYIDTFKKLADDMDTQYLEIRNARKTLFEYDNSADYGVEIDLEPNRCDEMVDWTVCEPDIYVEDMPLPAPAGPGVPANPFIPGNAAAQQINNVFQNLFNSLLPPAGVPMANNPTSQNPPAGQPGNGPSAVPNAVATNASNHNNHNAGYVQPFTVGGGNFGMASLGPPIYVPFGPVPAAAPQTTQTANAPVAIQASAAAIPIAHGSSSENLAVVANPTGDTVIDANMEEDEWVDSADSSDESGSSGSDMEFDF